MKDPNEIEEAMNSKFAEFLVKEKVEGFMQKKYRKYRNWMASGTSMIFIVMGYMGYDNFETHKLLTQSNDEVAALQARIVAVSDSVEMLVAEYRGELMQQSTKINGQLEDLEKHSDLAENQGRFLGSIIDRSQTDLTQRDDLFQKRLLMIEKQAKDIDDQKNDVEQIIKQYQQQLVALDSSKVRLKLDQLTAKVKSLESTEEDIFSIGNGDIKQISLGDKKFTFEAMDMNSSQVEIKSGGNDVVVLRADEREQKIDNNVYLKLVSLRRTTTFGKRIATIKIFSRQPDSRIAAN